MKIFQEKISGGELFYAFTCSTFSKSFCKRACSKIQNGIAVKTQGVNTFKTFSTLGLIQEHKQTNKINKLIHEITGLPESSPVLVSLDLFISFSLKFKSACKKKGVVVKWPRKRFTEQCIS